MRRLGLLAPVSLYLLTFACTRDNPAFDCETDGSCVDESGTRGDGDGDPSDGDPGDGDPGDGDPGDGDPGDGDPGDGDGDGDAGDGDGDAGDGDAGDGDAGDGDGDGDPLPTCPDSVWVSMPIVQDTFLDASPAQNGNTCVIDWDFGLNQPSFGAAACPLLDFGGAPGHWACAGDGCSSSWLGEFELEPWMQVSVQVVEAQIEFTAKYKNGLPNTMVASQLVVDGVDFGQCGDWHAGDGHGDPADACVTTFYYSAFPSSWQDNDLLLQGEVIGAAPIPATGDAYAEDMFVMPISHVPVQSWLDGETDHHGVLMSSSAGQPTQMYLFAQESGMEPKLQARLCVP